MVNSGYKLGWKCFCWCLQWFAFHDGQYWLIVGKNGLRMAHDAWCSIAWSTIGNHGSKWFYRMAEGDSQESTNHQLVVLNRLRSPIYLESLVDWLFFLMGSNHPPGQGSCFSSQWISGFPYQCRLFWQYRTSPWQCIRIAQRAIHCTPRKILVVA